MSYNVKSIEIFEKQAKRLIKKYASLRDELLDIVRQLKEEPQQGVSLGHNCYKIRIAIASEGKGKSGGASIITNFVISDDTVYLFYICDKSEKDSISDKDLKELLRFISQ